MVTERPTILESWSGKKLGFFQVGSARGAQRVTQYYQAKYVHSPLHGARP
jgi:hypothetical protein